MTTFWIIAAAIVIVGPLFVAFPLLKNLLRPAGGKSGAERMASLNRDQLVKLGEDRRAGSLAANQYQQARSEIESRLLEELPDVGVPAAAPVLRRYRAAVVAASIAVSLLAVAMYFALGNPGLQRSQPEEGAHGLGQQQLSAMIERLAARLNKNPQDAKGWAMLARAQTVLGRFGEASTAYAKAAAILPGDAQLLADYADALAMAQGGRLPGEPEKLVERALLADPNNSKALALAGTIAFDKQDFALAVLHWERLRSSIPPDSEFAKSIQANIAEAKSLSLAHGAKREVAGALLGDPKTTTRR